MNKSLCIFTNDYPYGFQEAFLENEVPFLCDNFDTVYIVPTFGADSFRKTHYSNLKILKPILTSRGVDLSTISVFLNIYFWFVFFKGLKENFQELGYIKKLIKQAIIITKFKSYIKLNRNILDCDLWYFYWGTNAASVLAFFSNVPKSIVRMHGYDLYSSSVRKGQFQVFQRQIIENSKKVFLISQNGMNFLSKKYESFAQRFMISRLGVPDRGEAFMSEDKVLRIVTCSNIQHVKRLNLLALALVKLTKFRIEWVHFGAGEADLEVELNEIMKNSEDNISYILKGQVSNTDIMKYYRSAPVDLFINVSSSEGLPVSIMEALSFGIPVMATDVGGSRELVLPSNGILLDENISPSNLANQVSNFYYNSHGDSRLRESSRKAWNQLVNSKKNFQLFADNLKDI